MSLSPENQSAKLSTPDIDVLLVGGGFSGIYLLHHLRRLHFSVKIFEAASGLGGTWYWNCYPGARSDSDFHIYQLSIPDLWNDPEWKWTERYPARDELMNYFDLADRKLELSKDVLYNTTVIGAKFDQETNRWIVEAENGVQARPKYLIFGTGFASKPLYPNIPGLDTFAGPIYHTARWPQAGVALEGKRVGVIGTGSSGVQVIQELGPKVKQLTVFQRTPNIALPMVQRNLDEKALKLMRSELYPVYFKRRAQTFAGFHHGLPSASLIETMKESPEQVRLDLEEFWAKGGFYMWLAAYSDVLSDVDANRIMYDFWKKKVRERIESKEMQEKLAPDVPPHYYGIRRPSLEQTYWETYNLPHVSLVDLNRTPITSITPQGVATSDGIEHHLDAVVLATGFDAVSGPISQIKVEGTDGRTIGEKWKEGLQTYLGVMTHGYPNMFFIYGPHGPTQFCNAPTCIEIQADWIIKLLEHLRSQNQSVIEPLAPAEADYSNKVNEIFGAGLWLSTKSSYNGANVPGKKVESMNYTAGVPAYRGLLKEEEEGGYKGFALRGNT